VNIADTFHLAANLVNVNKVDFRSKKFKTLCLSYGTEEIYTKILEFLE
jgi:hypothetical protein